MTLESKAIIKSTKLRGKKRMQDPRVTFDKALCMITEKEQAAGKEFPLSETLAWYRNTTIAGELDVSKTYNATREEFVQMAYWSLMGAWPKKETLDSILAEGEKQTELKFREKVIFDLMHTPGSPYRDRRVTHNIYFDAKNPLKAKINLKNLLLVTGVQMGRNLPAGIKEPLKKFAVKYLIR